MVGENVMPLILGVVCGPNEVAVLKVGTIVVTYFLMGSSIAHVFYPQVVQMVTHQASGRELTNLLIKVGRLEFLIATMLVGGFYIMGRDFLFLWVGESLDIETAWRVGLITTFFVPVASSFGLAWFVLYAKNLVKFRVLIGLGCNILGTAVGYYLTVKYGMFGLLWARFAFTGLLLVLISFIYFHKVGGLDMKAFAIKTYPKSLLPLIVGGGTLLIYLHYVPIASWYDFIASGTLFVVAYSFSAWILSLNPDEKNLVKGFLDKLKGPFKKRA